MLDFMIIATKSTKSGAIEIYPKFIIKKNSDLMIRGGDFYAIWIEEQSRWSTDENDAIQLIDKELDIYAKEHRDKFDAPIRVLHMWDSETGVIDSWHKYCQKQMRDSYHMLDDELIFLDTETTKQSYSTKRLSYPLVEGDYSSYEKLISTLYSEEERKKIEWSIGAIVTGDSKELQKFVVLYGSAGTGKSTIINIIQMLFDGYYTVFSSKALGSSNSTFALETFKSNPLVAIEHDGDLSRIEDNTRLNSLVSHELMTVNEKFKSIYSNKFHSFLIMGSNKPVMITDAKSGLIRRLIDISPTGNKLSHKEYKEVMSKIPFELGAIACHCREVYLKDPNLYDDYIPVSMLGATNDFYNFILDSYNVFEKEDGTTLKVAWEMYKTYCEEANVHYTPSKRVFKEELKNYFDEYFDRGILDDGSRVRNVYKGFNIDRFEESNRKKEEPKQEDDIYVIDLKEQESLFDKAYSGYLAQYEDNMVKWNNCKTTLADIDTSKIHFIQIPEEENHIVIDFDIRNENGEKDFEKNLAEASKFPKTYAECSKSGGGIHLHYIYNGDVSKLKNLYGDNIEIKKFNGNSSLRRKLTKCNDIPIATLSSGLPLKEENVILNQTNFNNEQSIRTLIKKNLKKEYHAGTKPSIDFIYKILEDAYNSGMKYDVSDLFQPVLIFATHSTHNKEYCVKLVSKMKFKSEETETIEEKIDDSQKSEIVFFDVEVFPNLFLLCYKKAGKENNVVKFYNPSPTDISQFIKYRLIGFNNRKYDNHILYGRLIGYSNEELYNLSQSIITKNGSCMFREAYNLSYTDIYDFASAGNKKSLKAFEIELDISHKELGLPWDKPVPEELWEKVGEYCVNDVEATEAVFNYLSADFTARKILSDVADMSVNDTTNTLTTKIIFGNNRNPQSEFNYRNLAQPVTEIDDDTLTFLKKACPEMMAEKFHDISYLPYFEGYEYKMGVSTYKGIEIGEGGRVYAEPGMYYNVALLDIASMHPHSLIAEILFGIKYTTRFRDIVEGRVSIKHKDWEALNDILDGKLIPYVDKVENGEITNKDLANALKTAINSVYGLTSANFDNPFRDKRNIDNIVAKRGALFMIDLCEEVQKRGFTVAHIKTDSIKIPNATPEIINFVMEFGKKYGYTFEHEATYEKMCLVNDAVYIAKYKDAEECKELYGYIPDNNKDHGGDWTPTGKQFAVPYVFKKLFSKEDIHLSDLKQTFSVTTALYLDMNEKLKDTTEYENVLDARDDSDNGKKITRTQQSLLDLYSDKSREDIQKLIDDNHDYKFVGKTGSFIPVKQGGGRLVRQMIKNDGTISYNYAPGSKGYRWVESEIVNEDTYKDLIDISYYDKLAEDAIYEIAKYGDFWIFAES